MRFGSVRISYADIRAVGFGLLLSAALTVVVKGLVALGGHSVAWWLAALLSLVVVFGGFLIFTDGALGD